jgi:hypothetical protein
MEFEVPYSSRRHTLECPTINIKIVDTKLMAEGHVMYAIQVSSSTKKWTVHKRYSDFTLLDKNLRNYFPEMKHNPPLPPKRYFGSSIGGEFVNTRKQQLEIYLTALLKTRSIWAREDLALFLNNDVNTMTKMWNFDKMNNVSYCISRISLRCIYSRFFYRFWIQ